MEEKKNPCFTTTIVFNKWFRQEWSVDAKISEWTIIGAQNILRV